jgi:hypothetical protein
LDEAATWLTRTALSLRTPITVTTAPSPIVQPADLTGIPRHIVLPYRATWDRDWAAAARETLERTARDKGQAALDAHASARAHRDAAASCHAFAARWQKTPRTDLADAAAVAAAAVSKADRTHGELTAAQKSRRTAAQQARTDAEQAREAGRVAERHTADAAALAGVISNAGALVATRPSVEEAHTDALRRIEEAKADAVSAAARIQSALKAAAGIRASRRNWQQARNNLGVEHAAPDPGGNLNVVEAAWRTLRDELSTLEQGLAEADLLERAGRKHADALAKRDRFTQDTLEHAAGLSATVVASSRESLNIESAVR